MMKIYYKQCERTGMWLWAWEESARLNVWGGVDSFDDIERRAGRMFPGQSIDLAPVTQIAPPSAG